MEDKIEISKFTTTYWHIEIEVYTLQEDMKLRKKFEYLYKKTGWYKSSVIDLNRSMIYEFSLVRWTGAYTCRKYIYKRNSNPILTTRHVNFTKRSKWLALDKKSSANYTCLLNLFSLLYCQVATQNIKKFKQRCTIKVR